MSPVRKTRVTHDRLQFAEIGFYLDREASGCTDTTLIWYRKYVGEIVVWFGEQGVTDPAEITPNHLRALLIAQQQAGRNETSVHHYAAAAKAFLNYCVSDGLITVSPMAKVRMPRLPKEILPAFDVQQVKLLLRFADNSRDQAIVLCLLDTGCRVAEFTRLKLEDVDIASGTVRVWQGKGRKDRLTFLGVKARRALHKYLSTRPMRQGRFCGVCGVCPMGIGKKCCA